MEKATDITRTVGRRDFLTSVGVALAGIALGGASRVCADHAPFRSLSPNIVLVMTDDQGWGQTGYYGHPALKTPNLDAMAANGLRFDRFYAGAPVCSPTRATVLTGRANDRCGVRDHGYPLRRQEKTLAQALKRRGCATGHFGKWHLDGFRGPGAPVLPDDPHGPGAFGFDTWVSATNYIDMDPVLSRQGEVEAFKGYSSDVIVDEALKFIAEARKAKKPFLAVVWDGSPHRPYIARPEDQKRFPNLDENSRKHYAELAAFDRSVGTLRQGLRDLGVAGNTLVWYCSDNGGLGRIEPGSTGGLRGLKGSVWEGGLRVPCIIEWPSLIKPRITAYPAATMDIFPTVADILNLPKSDLLRPVDGISLVPLFSRDIAARTKPIAFKYGRKGALVDNDYKLLTADIRSEAYQLYDLKAAPHETKDIAVDRPEVLARMESAYATWLASVEASVAGKDYAEGEVLPEPRPRGWPSDERYQALFDAWEKKGYRRLMRYANRSRTRQ